MENIKFIKGNTIYSCELTSYSDRRYNKKRIYFNDTVPSVECLTSGFYTLNINNNYEEGNYTALKYIYLKEDDRTFILTESENDIWTKPVIPDPIPVPEPTPEEIAEQLRLELESGKVTKIQESKDFLSQYLQSNPLVSKCHNNTNGTYSITEDKQILMSTAYVAYQVDIANNKQAVLRWNETGKVSEIWTETEFIQLMVEIKNFVSPLIVHQQTLEEQIKNIATIEELNEFFISY